MSAIEGSCAGFEDFELHVPRERPVTYLAEVPDDGPAQGLVFLIHGFGGDRDPAYSATLRRYLTDKYKLVTVIVHSHCYVCRPNDDPALGSVRLVLEESSIYTALGQLAARGHKIDVGNGTNGEVVKFLKSFPGEPIRLNAFLVPPANEYQNFGVLSALDHLCVLNDLIDRGIEFDRNNIVCAGSSHGGYLAHMIHKFAPNTISGVIEASAYTGLLPSSIDSQFREYMFKDDNINIFTSVVTKWQLLDACAPRYLGADQALIRDVALPSHIADISRYGPRRCQFRMIHSAADHVSPIETKKRQAELLNGAGFDATLDVIEDSDVDGKFIKSTDHGMGIALNTLFDRYYPTLTSEPTTLDRDLGTEIRYRCGKLDYVFRHSDKPPYLTAACEPVMLEPAAQAEPQLVSA